jgi:hypothetical protein
MLIMLSGFVSAAYAFKVQLPAHLVSTHTGQAEASAPSLETWIYSLTSIFIYGTGCGIAMYTRRYLVRLGIIEA